MGESFDMSRAPASTENYKTDTALNGFAYVLFRVFHEALVQISD